MKTHVIELQSYDDIYSVSDKLKWVKSDRVLITFPKSSINFGSKLDLIRLQRISQAHNYLIGIITTREDTRAIAFDLNIPVFQDQEESRHKTWKTKKFAKLNIEQKKERLSKLDFGHQNFKHPSKFQRLPWVRLISFASVLISLIMIAIVLVPRAKIIIYPSEQIQMLDLEIKPSLEIYHPDISGNIPLYTEEIKILVDGKLESLEKEQIGLENSRGIVEIRGDSITDVEVPLGSVILIVGESQFRLLTLERAVIHTNQTSSLFVPVQCEPPGEACNLSRETQIQFEGYLDDFLEVSLTSSLEGGKDIGIPRFSDEDLQNQKSQLLKNAELLLKSQLKNMGNEEKIYLDVEFIPIEIIEISTDVLENNTLSTYELSLEIIYNVHYVQRKDIRDISQAALGAALSNDWLERPGTLFWERFSEISNNKDDFTFHIRAAQLIHRKINTIDITNHVAGKTRNWVTEFLSSNYDFREEPKIDMSLINIWLPLLPANIEIELQ